MWTVNRLGAAIPALGFGTFKLAPADARRMVEHVLGVGYRHIDTAQGYRNEAEVGAAIAASNVPRDEIFVTTKVWPDNMQPGKLQRSVQESLGRLKLDRVDLVLLHWPNPKVDFNAMFDALNAVHADRLTRHIGISNYPSALIERAVEASESPLVTNQVEYHPFLSQRTLLAAVRGSGMSLTAYCPLAQGRVFSDATLAQIGARHGKNPGQVALRWLIQRDGVIAIPRTGNEAHAERNFDVFDFELDDTEMDAIAALGSPAGRLVNPEGLAPEWDRD